MAEWHLGNTGTPPTHAEDAQRLSDEEFAIQVELEELTVEQIRNRAEDLFAQAPVSLRERVAFAFRVLVALHRSPLLTADEADERFSAWRQGSGIPTHDMQQAIQDILNLAQLHQRWRESS